LLGTVLLGAAISPATAGSPYMTDDPEPADYQHFEIYAFTNGMADGRDSSGEAGIDFNYGAAPNLRSAAGSELNRGRGLARFLRGRLRGDASGDLGAASRRSRKALAACVRPSDRLDAFWRSRT
jgi:hypothetical protein